jgi:hypothetical protein
MLSYSGRMAFSYVACSSCEDEDITALESISEYHVNGSYI